MVRHITCFAFGLLLVVAITWTTTIPVATQNRTIGINVVLRTDITPAIVKDISRFGRVLDTIPEIDALSMRAREMDLPAIAALPYVAAANPDAERKGAPVDTVPVADFANGLSTWDLDAVNVTDFESNNRQVPYDGSGVYVAVLDTGLLDSWRQYFPQERIAVQYAKSFSGAVATEATCRSHQTCGSTTRTRMAHM